MGKYVYLFKEGNASMRELLGGNCGGDCGSCNSDPNVVDADYEVVD